MVIERAITEIQAGADEVVLTEKEFSEFARCVDLFPQASSSIRTDALNSTLMGLRVRVI